MIMTTDHLTMTTRVAHAAILNLFGGILIQKRRAEVALEIQRAQLCDCAARAAWSGPPTPTRTLTTSASALPTPCLAARSVPIMPACLEVETFAHAQTFSH